MTLTSQISQQVETASQREAIVPLLAEFTLRFPLVLASTRSSGSDQASLRASSPSDEFSTYPLEATRAIFAQHGKVFPALQWDVARAARESRTDFGYEPVAAFTQLRHMVFTATMVSQNERLTSILSQVESERAKEIIAHILNQSYFVTSNSVPCLSASKRDPLLSRFDSLLSSYIKEEDGHHNLIVQALTGLGRSVEPLKVHWSVEAAMDILRWSAANSRFALANCLGLFEQASYSDTDPVAERLDQIGLLQAARPLWTHFEINKRSEHACIGLALASQLESISLEDLAVAAQCAEMLCRLFAETEAHYMALVEAEWC